MEQRKEAKEFAAFWKDKGYEKGQSQQFWMSLLRKVFGVKDPETLISFEDQVMLDHTSFIDGFIPSTHVLIEQKSINKELNAAIKQSDNSWLTPFQQAKRYAGDLPYSQRPRWIVTCNFKEFYVYDMEQPNGEPTIIQLANLPQDYYLLNFLVDKGSEHVKKEMALSIAAGNLVGELYDEIHKLYLHPDDVKSQQSLNKLCVRLVFCLYAEDAGIFGAHGMFGDYLKRFEARDLRRALMDLFKVLDTPEDKRDPYLEPKLAAFPYVDGGLFANENIEIPQLTEDVKKKLLENASEGFDWSGISPTIFGAVFESTLNPETRRKGGMHYTSIENIHKVIDSLFLDDLRDEFAQIRAVKVKKTREGKLRAFQEKIAGLTFLDPACGSGNFLTETFLSLRRLENEILKELTGVEMIMGDIYNPIKVSIGQFYGIEINDFAVTVARTALWIAEAQMLRETEDIINMRLDFLPLKSYTNIHEGNALRMNWEDVISKDKLNYIMGNPPFVGYSLQSKEQKADLLSIYVDEQGKPYKTAGKIDFVAGWFFKAAQLMTGTDIRTAFVSTNSITQGEQVTAVWKPLYDRFDMHINFAWRTFKWASESNDQAAVHCVIVGFSCSKNAQKKFIFLNGHIINVVVVINPYLIEGEVVWIGSRNKPICDVLQMETGNRPADGGHLIIEDNEYEDFIKREPKAAKFIKQLIGATEYINNKKRYCLWLVDATPADIRQMPLVMERVEACKQDRLHGADDRKKLAHSPTLFRETKNPKSYLIVPNTSSENRRYIPLGFLGDNSIPTNSATIICNARLYEFGILSSNVHMAWMRTVAGRLKSDYRYSKDIVYNNFPWPTPTEAQKAKIEQTAQEILDARNLYPDSSLADLYDETTMPPELRNAHQANDKAVMEAYGFDWRSMKEPECVAELMKMYQKLVEREAAAKPVKKSRTKKDKPVEPEPKKEEPEGKETTTPFQTFGDF